MSFDIKYRSVFLYHHTNRTFFITGFVYRYIYVFANVSQNQSLLLDKKASGKFSLTLKFEQYVPLFLLYAGICHQVIFRGYRSYEMQIVGGFAFFFYFGF